MRDKLYIAMIDFLKVISQLEDIKTNLTLQRNGIQMCNELTHEQIESLLSINLRLIEIAINDAYKHYSSIDGIIIEMKHINDKSNHS